LPPPAGNDNDGGGPATTTAITMAKVASNGAFQGENPLDFALPLIILQICLVLVVTRGLDRLPSPPAPAAPHHRRDHRKSPGPPPPARPFIHFP